MDAKRTGAIKRWFEQLLKSKLNIDPIDGWARLYERHVATITHLLNTGTFKSCEGKLSSEVYAKAYEALKKQSVDSALLEQLKPELAATGDNFEVVKFLVVLLNELRIAQPVVFEEDYGLTDTENKHIGAVLRYLEDQQNWDPYESWPAVLFPCSDGPINSRNPITPKIRRPSRGMVRSERKETRRSPLFEVVTSPRSHELRKAREKDKKLKALNERCKLLEFEKEDLESSLRCTLQETSKYIKSLNEMTELVSEKESRCRVLSTELEDWRSKATEAKDEINDLKQQLQVTKKELSITQRQLREVEFDVSTKHSEISGWQKTATWEEQQRVKLEREREEFLQELEVLRSSESAVKEQLRQYTTNNEAEIAELRLIIEALRSELKEARQEKEEALLNHNEQLNQIQKESNEIVKNKESEIAKLGSLINKMNKQLNVAQLSVKDVRKQVTELRNLCAAFENRCVEIHGLRLLFTNVQNGCQALQQDNTQKSAMIESLRNNVAIAEHRSKALAASLEEQQRKHMETMAAKQALLNEKEQFLYEAWNQLHASAELNTRLQEELTQRDVACHVLEQRLASAEERYSTISQRLSINSVAFESKPTDETFRTNVSFGALPHEFHPLPEVEDENDLLSSSSVTGDPYVLNVEARYGLIVAADESQELNTSVDSTRLAELNRRNKSVAPHLRSAYAAELQRVSPKNLDEEALKNAENFIPPKKKDTNINPVSPSSLSMKKNASRSLRSVKRQFSKIMQDSCTRKVRSTDTEVRNPFKPKN